MRPGRTATGLLALVVLAFLGYLLITLPPRLVEQYQAARDLGPVAKYLYAGAVGTGLVLLSGASLWIVWGLWRRTVQKHRRRERRAKNPSELSRQQQQQEIDENLAAVEDLRGETPSNDTLRRELDPLLHELDEKRASQRLEIVAFGTVSSGKSSVLNALAGRELFRTDAKGGTTTQRNKVSWPGLDQVLLVDTPGLGEIDGEAHVRVATESARDADLVLLVVDGPLRESEHALLRRLGEMEKRILVCLNKEDWYSERDKSVLMQQISGQVEGLLEPQDLLAVRAQPAQRKRVRVLSDGSQCEETVDVEPDIGPLAQRMLEIVRHDGTDLLMANLLLRSRGLVEDARQRVRDALDVRAWQTVDHYMWGAGGAAAINPFPMVDVVAGTAISTKMVFDLARIYRQDIDGGTAVTLLGQLGKNLIAILGISAATPAIASLVASLLKAVPGAGTIAGGLLQGVVQAIVTRWIGAVFIQYFKNEMQFPEGGLTSVARRQWDQVTSIQELRKLLKNARARLGA